MKKILLIDGNSFFFRAFFGSISLIEKENPTNAIFTSIRMLKKFLDDHQGYQQICFFFDISKKNFRRDLFANYKANRKPTPPALFYQLPIFKQFLNKLKIQFVEKEGYEADDLVASAAKIAVKNNFLVDIISSDRDFLQVITPEISLYLLNSGINKIKKITISNFYENFQMYPEQIIDYKAIAGDKSDSIPGIRKVGPITAINLLSDYGNLEKIYLEIDNLPKPLQEKLQNQKEDVALFKKIIKLVTDVPLKIDFSQIKIDFFSKECVDFYKKYNFDSLINADRKSTVPHQHPKKFFT